MGSYGVERLIVENFPQISVKFPQTFRRISAPFPGAIKRISLQISAKFPQNCRKLSAKTFRKNPFANDPISELPNLTPVCGTRNNRGNSAGKSGFFGSDWGLLSGGYRAFSGPIGTNSSARAHAKGGILSRGALWAPSGNPPLLRTLLRTLLYCTTHSRPPSQNPSENPSPEP